MKRNILESLSYIPGTGAAKTVLLSRYIPPIPGGVVSTWLNKNIQKGSWILDPFCAAPHLPVEAARSGYRVLVTANNPIARFLIELAANPPSQNDLKSALAVLASSYKGNERIEPHIKSLYSTYCARCGQLISAEQFLWEHGSTTPYSRIYTCPFCGDYGEHPCTSFDAERARQFSNTGLHKARALERVVSSADQDRIHVEQALSVYLPRALYGLITVINKLEGLRLSKDDQKNLSALLLYTFDQSNTMWRVPSTKERRRQLTVPRHFREKNIWLSLEQGVDLWNQNITDENYKLLPVTWWPELPPESGGICLYEGRLLTLADSLSSMNIKAVCAALPRPNQAFWTLSALWAGWLWGREAVGTFKSVLHRLRYDWAWHTTALASVFKQLGKIVESDGYIFSVIGEAEAGFIASALVSAGFAGCNLQGIAIQEEEDQAQLLWKCKPEINNIFQPLAESGITLAKSYLESRGEPASYLNTISAALINIVEPTPEGKSDFSEDKKNRASLYNKNPELKERTEPTPALAYSQAYNSAREALSYRSGFLRFTSQEITQIDIPKKNQSIQESLFSSEIGKTILDEEESEVESSTPANDEEKERPSKSSEVSESELIWLRDTDKVNHLSATDNYELVFQNYLMTHPGSSDYEIYSMMCERFPGLFTPAPEFIRLLLESYGDEENGLWYIRQEDKPNERQNDIVITQSIIHKIAEQLSINSMDMKSSNIPNIVWKDDRGEFNFKFYLTVTANIGDIVLYQEKPGGRGFVVLPGSRANLLFYKLRRDPRLNRALDPDQGDWQIIKFRHLKSLAENPLLSRENFDQLINLDPITYSTPQIRLI